MSSISDPRLAHFKPNTSDYTQTLILGPKFLASIFRSDPTDDEIRQQEFSQELLKWIRDEEIAYKRILINQHALDEAATHLKKHSSPDDAFQCVRTVMASKIFVVDVPDDNVFERACDTFCEFEDHEGALTDFITKTFLEDSDTPYLATWDGHYQSFRELKLLPRCDYP